MGGKNDKAKKGCGCGKCVKEIAEPLVHYRDSTLTTALCGPETPYTHTPRVDGVTCLKCLHALLNLETSLRHEIYAERNKVGIERDDLRKELEAATNRSNVREHDLLNARSALMETAAALSATAAALNAART